MVGQVTAVISPRRVVALATEPRGLVWLAYRATFAGTFTLNATALRRMPIVRGSGFGRDVIERGLRASVKAGYIECWQPRRATGKTFARAGEKLSLASSGLDSAGNRPAAAELGVPAVTQNHSAARLRHSSRVMRSPAIFRTSAFRSSHIFCFPLTIRILLSVPITAVIEPPVERSPNLSCHLTSLPPQTPARIRAFCCLSSAHADIPWPPCGLRTWEPSTGPTDITGRNLPPRTPTSH